MALPNPAVGIPQNAPSMNYKDPVVEEIRDVKLSLQEAVTTGLKSGFMTTSSKFLEKIPLVGKSLSEKVEFEKRKMFEAQGRDPLTGRKLTKEELEERELRKKSMGATARIDDNVEEILGILTKQYGSSASERFGFNDVKKGLISAIGDSKKVVPEDPKTTPYALEGEEPVAEQSELSKEEAAIEKQKLDREVQEEIQEKEQTFFERLFAQYFGGGGAGGGGGGVVQGGGGGEDDDGGMSPLTGFLLRKGLGRLSGAAAGRAAGSAAASTAAASTAAPAAASGGAAASTAAGAAVLNPVGLKIAAGVTVAAVAAIVLGVLAYKSYMFMDKVGQYFSLENEKEEVDISEDGEVAEESEQNQEAAEEETPTDTTDTTTPAEAEPTPTEITPTAEPTTPTTNFEGDANNLLGKSRSMEGQAGEEGKVYPYGKAPEGVIQSEWDKFGGKEGFYANRKAKQDEEFKSKVAASKAMTDEALGRDKEKYPYGKAPEGQIQSEWDKKKAKELEKIETPVRMEGGAEKFFVGSEKTVPMEGGAFSTPVQQMEGGIALTPTAVPAKIPTTSNTLTGLKEENDILKMPAPSQPIVAPTTNNVVTNNSNTSVMSATSATRTGIDLDERALRRGQY